MIFQSMHENKVRRVVGMMSGTSVDGVDAALVEIGQHDGSLQIKLLAFENNPYPEAVREQIFALFRPETATVDKVGAMNVILGQIYAQAALAVIQKAGLDNTFRVKIGGVDYVSRNGRLVREAQPE